MAACYLTLPTLFYLKAFSILLCSVISAFSHWKRLPLRFSLCPFFFHPPLLFYLPLCPPQHMLDLHVPLTLLPLCMLSWLLAPRWVGWQERRSSQQEAGRACQCVLPPYWDTGTGIRFSAMECWYTIQRGQWGGGARGVGGVPCEDLVTVGSKSQSPYG